MTENYRADVFRTRAVSAAVAEERGYRQYGGRLGLDPIFEADFRYATESIVWPARPNARYAWQREESVQTYRNWVAKKTKDGELTGWVMPKHSIPGSAFDDPLAQLRPDLPLPREPLIHAHLDLSPFELEVHLTSEKRQKQHEVIGGDLDREHRHENEAKYLLPPGPYGKRWDTHPRCTPDRFLSAERVFLHLEGTLKLDALVSAGEVGIDVPSVTLWNRRRDDASELDFSVPRPQWKGSGGGFWADWEEYGEEHAAELDEFEKMQTGELRAFLETHVQAPVIVVCDRDWRTNPRVTMEAFSLRDRVRSYGLQCVVAAPGKRTKSKGSDDFLYRGGRVDNLTVVEPLPRRARGWESFARDYRDGRGDSGRRRPSNVVEQDLAILDWYVTHATELGFVRRAVRRIADRLPVGDKSVRRATLRLAEAGALAIEGSYLDPEAIRELRRRYATSEPREERTRSLPLIRVREDLQAPRWEPTVRA